MTTTGVVISSIFALEQLKAPEAVDPLLEFLDQDNKEVSRRSISALRAIGDPKAVAPLIELFGDGELGRIRGRCCRRGQRMKKPLKNFSNY